MTIDSAVYYLVPEGDILPPKGFYVVASKPARFYGYYGMNPSGNFKGNLSNAGEYILINDKSSNEILSFTYSDQSPWPSLADGDGYSLVATASLPSGDPDDYRYWKSSVKKGGSPFSDDENTTAVGDVNDNPDNGKLTIYPNPASDAFNVLIDDQTSENITLKLINVSGKTVLIRNIENNSEINLSETGLASGLYIVTVEYKGVYLRSVLIYAPVK